MTSSSLAQYLGSKHSAVGLILFWFGLPAAGIGLIYGLTVSNDEFPQWISVSLAIWGVVAVPLGLSMRRTKPSRSLWVFANAWLAAALIAFLGIRFFGR